MTPLAHEIYAALRAALQDDAHELTYAELLAALRRTRRRTGRRGDPLPRRPRAPSFFAALTEVTRACQAHHLPLIAAIVCKRGARRPGDGFYKVAFPRVRSEAGRIARWRVEREKVLAGKAMFPARLSDGVPPEDAS